MDVRLRTEVAQLSIVAGTQRDKASNMGIVQRSPVVPVGTGKGNLYVLVDVTGDPSGKQDICRELVEIIAEEYFRVPGGITNGLRQAMKAANELLHRRNLDSLPLWRRTGEASCAVLRDHDLYVGLAGGAVAYVIQGNRVRLFPRASARKAAELLADEQPALPALGLEELLLEVGLFHCGVEAADIILLGSSTLPQLVSRQQMIGAAQGGLHGVTDSLSSAASVADLCALVIKTEHQAAEGALGDELRVAQEAGVGPAVRNVPIERVTARDKAGSGSRTVVGALLGVILAFFAGLGAKLRAFLCWLASSGIFGTIGRGLRAAFVGVLRALGALGRQMLPEREAVPQPMEVAYPRRARAVSSRRTDRLLPAMGVLGIVCIIAAIAGGVILQLRSSTAHFNELLGQARAERELALESPAAANVREHLRKAQELLSEAAEIRPSDPGLATLRGDVLLALDEINRVVRLDFSAYVPFEEPERQPRRVLLRDGDVYVLDPGTQQLHSYVVDELGGLHEPLVETVLLSPQDQPGSEAIRELNDFVWMEAGNGRESSNLLLLVNGGSILRFDDARGFTPVSVADTIVWNTPRLIDGYFGYFYVLDSEQDRILKYTPTGDSYDTSPADYLQAGTEVELDSAVDMAIDGDVYVLLADASILKFQGGRAEDFSISGLDDPGLQNPTAIFSSPDTEYIYLADAGNERIVQLDKEGAFVRQFLPTDESEGAFQNLQDVFVDEAGGELLVLSSDRLSLALMPEPPEAE